MKIIIAGSRTITDYNAVLQAICNSPSSFAITEVVSGVAAGPDRLGEQFAEEAQLPIKRFPADWQKHGRGAGYIRNTEMARYADGLIAVWDGKSNGTRHMIRTMEALGKLVHVEIVK